MSCCELEGSHPLVPTRSRSILACLRLAASPDARLPLVRSLMLHPRAPRPELHGGLFARRGPPQAERVGRGAQEELVARQGRLLCRRCRRRVLCRNCGFICRGGCRPRTLATRGGRRARTCRRRGRRRARPEVHLELDGQRREEADERDREEGEARLLGVRRDGPVVAREVARGQARQVKLDLRRRVPKDECQAERQGG